MATVADLDTLRLYVGAVSTKDDNLLQARLDTATAWVTARVYADELLADEVQETILLMASRLYSRRQSPEGVSGFGQEGFQIRIVANDPDIRQMLERHTDMSDSTEGVGIG